MLSGKQIDKMEFEGFGKLHICIKKIHHNFFFISSSFLHIIWLVNLSSLLLFTSFNQGNPCVQLPSKQPCCKVFLNTLSVKSPPTLVRPCGAARSHQICVTATHFMYNTQSNVLVFNTKVFMYDIVITKNFVQYWNWVLGMHFHTMWWKIVV